MSHSYQELICNMSFIRAPDAYNKSSTEFVRLTSIIQQQSILIIKYMYIF